MQLNNFDYVALDFETANSSPTSACSLGIICASNGKVVLEKYYLINPLEEFNDINVSIHNITYDDVCNEKTFPELWDEIYSIIDGNIVFAHNAYFDMTVLKSILNKYNLKWPNIKIGCTLMLSRICFKDTLKSFKLSNISSYLEVEHNHHNAFSDAYVCYYIIERCKRMHQVYDAIDLFEEVGLCFGEMNDKTYPNFKNCYNRFKRKEKLAAENKKLAGIVLSFTGKPKSMTKKDFKTLVIKSGGLYSREITRVINTFIIFTSPSKKHLESLRKLQEKKDIKVYNEEEIIKIINDK